MAKLQRPAIFKWRHFTPLELDHTTVWRGVQRYAPELEKRTRPQLKPTNKSWRVDEI